MAIFSLVPETPPKPVNPFPDAAGYYEGIVAIYSRVDNNLKPENKLSLLIKESRDGIIVGEIILDGSSGKFEGVIDGKGKVNFVTNIWQIDLIFEGVLYKEAISGKLSYYLDNIKYEEFWNVEKK